MSFIDVKDNGATPSNPPSGYLRIYPQGSSWKFVDPSGTVYTFSTGVTAEEVEDIVGAFFADSSTINVTYNDAGDVISADVIAGGVDHNSLANLTTGNPHTQYLLTSTASSTYQPLDGDLTAVAGLAGTGLVARTATNTMAVRTITAGTGISMSNGDGVSGNPTVTNSDTGTSAVSTHVGLSDPHTQYELEANLASDVRGTVLTGLSPSAGTVAATDSILQAFNKLQGTITAGVAAFAADVRNTVLTGLSTGDSSAVVATDSILVAIGKLQAQLDINSADFWTEVITTADIIVSSNTTLTNVTELAFTATAGSAYYCEYTVKFRCAATNTGIALTVGTSDTAAGTFAAQVNIPIAADGTAAIYGGNITAFDDVVVATGVQTAQPTWFIANIKGTFICTTGGTVVPKFRSEVNGSNVNFGEASVALIREFA